MKRTHSEASIYEASSSSTSPHVGDYKGGTKGLKGNEYDVFLSFRGEDTRKGFTDYLYTSLVQKEIRVFRDDNELRVGEKIGPELLCSIRQSTILIPIISVNYAFSKWCLRELAQMLKCKRSRQQLVWPIFYKVNPSQVRHLKGRFEDAIKAHKENGDQMVLKEWKKALKEVKEWEEALKEVGSLKGLESDKIHDGHEGAFVQTIVTNVMSELKRLFLLNVPKQLVGIDDRINGIMSSIDDKLYDTKIIGLYGMGGIGKTTLGKVLYNKLSSRFESRSFVENIRETYQCQGGIKCILNKLIYDIIGSHVSSVDEGIGVIKSRFTGKKFLVLLDDMDDSTTQLNALVKDGSWIGVGSIVIITTRDKRIFGKAKASYMYPLNELSMDQSLILFSRHAFRKDSPPSDYKVLSRDIVSTTRGLPLALEVIGSCLCGMIREVWEDTLEKLKKVPKQEVLKTLKISYEALENDQKQIFLDIACFFIGSCKQNPTYMWDACELFPKSGIEILSLMSLIKIDEDGNLTMHDQLRDLGRQIVRLENLNEPQERSRLWFYKEALDVLDNKKGTKKIEALSLGKCSKGKRYAAEQFKKLTNLRFLKVDGANFTGDFQSLLPKLRWLRWNGCPSDFVAVNFHPKKLVVLDLSKSAISEHWEGWDPLKMATELKVLTLTKCQSLKRTPDLSTFIRLEILNLAFCRKLKELHPSIGDIKTLVSLDVWGCERLKELPKGIGRMVELSYLDIQLTGIQHIPISSDCLMKELKVIKACNCLDLVHIPSSIGNLASLQRLVLGGCCSLTKIPDSIGNLASLIELNLRRTSITKLPKSIGNLQSLIELNLRRTSITKLPKSIGNLQSLRVLDIGETDITELPDAIGMMAKLQKLEAECCGKLEQVPSNICKLISLKELHLNLCGKLQELPELPSGLTNLSITCQGQSLPHLFQLTLLETLILNGCDQLECVPELPIGLSKLHIWRCGKLKALTNLSDLKHLQYFKIWESPSLKGSPDVSNFRRTQMTELGFKESWDLMGSLIFERSPRWFPRPED